MNSWKVALIVVGCLLLGVLLAGASFVFYLRRKTQDDSLVTQDHVQSSFNAANSGKVI